MEIDKESFLEIQQQMDYISHWQGRGNLEKLLFEENKPIVYWVDSIENPQVCCWGKISDKPFIGKMLRIYGEAVKGKLDRDRVSAFYGSLVNELGDKYAFIFVSSECVYDVDYEIGIRLAGFLRPRNTALCPLSIVLDFLNENPRKKSWKYQLSQAKRLNLQFRSIDKPNAEEIKMFVDMYAEMAVTKGLSQRCQEVGLQVLLQDPHYHLFVIYTPEGKPLAAHIDHVYGQWGYHIMSANSNLARELKGTTHLLMENVFEWMKNNGVRFYDMGRIGPGRKNSNSVYEFKKYSGGDFVQYNGEWIYVRKRWVEYLLAYIVKERW